MGLMDEIGSLTGEAAGSVSKSKIAGGLIQAIEQHPGGIGGLLGTLRQNGLGSHVDAWTNGEPRPIDPSQVEQGLGGTGIIERTAQNAGISPQIVTLAMTTLLPMILHHFAPGGEPAPQSQFGGLAGSLLGKLL